MEPIEPLRWLAVGSLAGMLLAALAVQVKESFDRGKSLSLIWTRSRRVRFFMGLNLTGFGALLCVSLAGWVIPYYGFSWWMYGLVGLAYLALLAVAWVPMYERPGEHSLLHPHFVGGAVVAVGAVIGFATILLAERRVPPVSYGLSAVALAYTAGWPLFMSARLRPYFLVLEIGMVVLFAAVIVSLSFGI